MSSDAAEELARVRAKYGPMGLVEVVVWFGAVAVMVVGSRFRHVDWYFFAGLVGSAVLWELTKYRLRRNAADYARASAAG
jgi:hypothetical protein